MNTPNTYHVIVLVTVNEHETQALLDAFVGKNKKPAQVLKCGLTYNDLGIHGGNQIMHTVCEMGAGGIGASQQRTRDAIDYWQPQAVIAVGIAFGLDEHKQCIGDVLISRQIQDYDLNRLNDDGTLTPRGDKPSSSDILFNLLRQINTNKNRAHNKSWPKVRFGLLLSGQKLVDNLSYRESLKALFPEAIGGEMEGLGIYVSASKANVDWIVIKAICDWGHNKNQGDKEVWQKLAAKNAATVLKAALKIGGLYGDVSLPEKVQIAETMPISTAPISIPIDISRIIKYAPAQLIGREAEIQRLNDVWNQAISGQAKRPRVLTFVALGGEGKTSLVVKWAASLAHDNWPGCERVFAWSFYSQGVRESASSDLFIKEALVFFGDVQMAESDKLSYDKGKRLAKLIGERRALLILDGVEPLQYPTMAPMDGKLKDDGLVALLKGLATSSSGLCVVTTRYSIPDLKAYWEGNAPEIQLKRLSKKAGVALLISLNVHGEPNEFEALVEHVRGHALTLNLLGSYLRDAHEGDIRKRDLVKLEEADIEEQGGHAFRVMDAYVQWFKIDRKIVEENKKAQGALAILQLLGLFDRPATANCLAELFKVPAIPNLTEVLVGRNEAQRNIMFSRLQAANLLTIINDTAGKLLALDTHPLLREYFAKQVREQHPGSRRNAHRRLYKHLCATANEGEHPSLADLHPLYQAVAHGCLAGMQQDTFDKVYLNRLTKQNAAYAVSKLGAFGTDLGAVACFFESPWCSVSPALTEDCQSWLLNQAGVNLRALGRLNEAIDPMQIGLEMAKKLKNWKNIATASSTLGEIELTLGEITRALVNAEQSIKYADQDGDVHLRILCRTRLAYILFRAGRSAEAGECYHQATVMQKEHHPEYPMLYSMRGVRYCSMRLAAPERAAWQVILEFGVSLTTNVKAISKCGIESPNCKILYEVSQYDSQISNLGANASSLLDIAYIQLTLGQTALYEVILDHSALQSTQSTLNISHSKIEAAVDNMRRAGQQQDIPECLLTRAWLRSLEGRLESAQDDLDEAWEIAQHGPMPLLMADIHLQRARLFFCQKIYLWSNPDGSARSAKDDLTDARRLIEKHGYLSRMPELEDAERAIVRKTARYAIEEG